VGASAVAHRLDGAAKAVAVTWRNTDLRRAQLSFGGAWTAEWSFTVGISIYAFRHGGVTAVGVVSLLRMLPAALAAPALTPYADRWRRDRVLASVSAVRAAATGAAAALVATVDARLAVYALAVVASVAAVLFRPVHSALLPSLCRTPYELTSANVVRGILDAAATLLGPALAAVFLVHGGVPAVFAAAALASAVSAGLMLTLHPADVPRDREQTQVGARLADGLRVVVRNRDLGILIGLTALQTVMRGAVGVFVVVVAIDLLGTGEPGVGSLTAAIGAGAVLGSLVTTLLVGTHRLARWYGVGVALWGLPLALLAARPTQPVALLLLALVGVGNALVDIGLFTLIARRAPDAVLAAVFGVLESACALGVAAGSLLAPLMINLVGTRNALVGVGLLSPVAVVAAWRRLRALDITVEHQDHEIDVLRGVPAFALLPLPAVEQLARGVERVAVAAGGVVFRQGDTGDRYYLIESGSAEVVGDGVTITTLGAGDAFGEIALLRRVPRTATVRATSHLQLLALSGERFLAVVTSFRPSAAVASDRVEGLLRRYAP
jgi:predicted MFS family arabinose efflux permease